MTDLATAAAVALSQRGSRVLASDWFRDLPFEAQYVVRKAFQEAAVSGVLDPLVERAVNEAGL